jgi:dTDP-4-dehydrorhamnose reductase
MGRLLPTSYPPSMSTTLVLGGTGFLGAHVSAAAFHQSLSLASLADPHGPPVIAVGRDPEASPRFCTPRDGVQYVLRDLVPPRGAEALLEELQPEAVYSCAALARIADCTDDPDRAERLNAEVPGEVATWCAAHGARLVHVSTDLVFGSTQPPAGGFTETCEVGPLSDYGRTKLRGERAVLKAHPEALVVRLPLLYGNSGGRGIGASDSLLEAIDRGEKPGLFHDEVRTPLEVSNVADALIELAGTDATGLLHLAGPERISRFDLGLAVLGAMGLEPDEAQGSIQRSSRLDHPGHEERPADVCLDGSAARGILEVSLLDVATGLAQAMR